MSPPMSFEDLIEVLEVPSQVQEKRRFMSRRPAWAPLNGAAYGGHVFAQAAWAASQTVENGMVIHNVTGYFTLPGLIDRPFIYTVEPISDGRSFSIRGINVYQPDTSSATSAHIFSKEDAAKSPGPICFTAHVSFKKDEAGSPGHQPPSDLHARYPFLKTLKIDELPEAPDVDTPWFNTWLATYPTFASESAPHPFVLTPFPGLSMKKSPMPTNTADPHTYRQLSFYAPLPHAPIPITASPNLHACAHLLASDRNSLFVISNALGFGDRLAKMASLSHTVVFHVAASELLFQGVEECGGEFEDEGCPRWWVQEAWTPRSAGGRGIHESWIWSPDGVHVASSWQEGLVRSKEGLSALAGLMKGKL